MEFLIITGLSGAGKTRAADVLEDLDYYCVDNMPVALIPRFAEFCAATQGRYEKVALVTDVREKGDIGALPDTIRMLRDDGIVCRVLYMDADTPAIIRRYKESRRPHPLSRPGKSVEDAVKEEKKLLSPVREMADFVVDTSSLTLGMLQSRLFELLSGEQKREIDVTVLSFGFKHGMPAEADLVFDARFMPNPFYVDALREKTGLDLPVKEYVFSFAQTREFMARIESLLAFLLPLYIEEGKRSLTVAIGCTGGRHRSVAIATALRDHLVAEGVRATNVNRDVDR